MNWLSIDDVERIQRLRSDLDTGRYDDRDPVKIGEVAQAVLDEIAPEDVITPASDIRACASQGR